MKFEIKKNIFYKEKSFNKQGLYIDDEYVKRLLEIESLVKYKELSLKEFNSHCQKKAIPKLIASNPNLNNKNKKLVNNKVENQIYDFWDFISKYYDSIPDAYKNKNISNGKTVIDVFIKAKTLPDDIYHDIYIEGESPVEADISRGLAFIGSTVAGIAAGSLLVVSSLINPSLILAYQEEVGRRTDELYKAIDEAVDSYFEHGGEYAKSLWIIWQNFSLTTYNEFENWLFGEEEDLRKKYWNINSEEFFDLTVPSLVDINLNNKEIEKFLELMFDNKMNSEGNVHEVLNSRFYDLSYSNHELGIIFDGYENRFERFSEGISQNSDIYKMLAKYSILTERLKIRISKEEYLRKINLYLKTNYPNNTGNLLNVKEYKHECELEVESFEQRYRINDIKRDSLKAIIKKVHCSFVNRKNLPAFEFLLKRATIEKFHYTDTVEEMICYKYEERYKSFCRDFKSIDKRVEKMNEIFDYIEDRIN